MNPLTVSVSELAKIHGLSPEMIRLIIRKKLPPEAGAFRTSAGWMVPSDSVNHPAFTERPKPGPVKKSKT